MRRKIPATHTLLCFEAAARHESYTRAAQELALTQSAVSRQVSALEEYLGQALFTRTRHGADMQQTLASMIRTSRQQRVCPIALLQDLQRHRTPAPSNMLRLPATNADPRGP